jgi:hypothetical protein
MPDHAISRRAVLRAGAAGLALLALPMRLVDVLASGSSGGTNTWTYSQWSSLVGSTFRVALPGGGSTNAKLAAATNLMPAGSSTTSGPQCFLLTFSAGLSTPLGDGTQSIYNAKVGTVQMYMSPGSATSSAQHYGSVVNRL